MADGRSLENRYNVVTPLRMKFGMPLQNDITMMTKQEIEFQRGRNQKE